MKDNFQIGLATYREKSTNSNEILSKQIQNLIW